MNKRELQLKETRGRLVREAHESSAPFVLFVSDLHMSDFTAGDDFLMGAEAREPFSRFIPFKSKTGLFAQVLDYACARAGKGQKVELVLLGDIVDNWESAGRHTAFAHQDFAALLESFRSKGHRVIYIRGNHDRFSRLIPADRLCTSYRNTRLNLFACHGHQFDRYNKAQNGPGRLVSNFFSRLEIRKMKRKGRVEYPFAILDNIKPLDSAAIKKYYKWLRSRYPLLKLFSALLFLDKLLLALLNFSDSDGRYGVAARDLADEFGFSLVVMGHTHIPVRGAGYINTGTWTPVIPSRRIPKSFKGYSYNPFLIARRTEGKNRADYYFWESDTRGFIKKSPMLVNEKACNHIRKTIYGMSPLK